MKDLSIRTMHATLWVPPSTRAMLDIGCNVGELLASVRKHSPETALAGCDVNAAAVEIARRNLPDADLRVCGAAELPFPDESFDCVTCVETLEHIPPPEWSRSLKEMRRVLKPGGRLVLRTPHAGLFGWLDTNNLRFRAPGLYRRILGRGRRDAGYAEGSSGVYWHHHFSRREILALVGDGWEVESTRFGGASCSRWGIICSGPSTASADAAGGSGERSNGFAKWTTNSITAARHTEFSWR